ncbi:MAG: MarR family transcriptional regulator [Parcubacteria group bacterium]|nr:MarR family transcriptional regulator [Parcubacteria group bacterium]
MESKQLHDTLSLLMLRASMKGKHAMSELAEEHGITLMQAYALCILEPGQPVPMNSLSTYLFCDPSNITGIVDRLVAGSFLERKESDKDRRVKTLTLTEGGLALRASLLRIATETRLPNLDDLSTSDVEKLISLLEKATGTAKSV